ncbi:MAG: TetR/AcrR family transcriptional regulator [Lachnospiraceae bacterium]|nr:TetR/AcrR family transcriptional regulator [Lachnospiraceae bacterium]
MNAENTYELILNTFFELLEKESLEKINVKKLCTYCNINRNTFYYHFKDLMDVLDHLFGREIAQMNADPVTSIQNEYRQRASMLYRYKKTVLHVYHSKEPEILYRYLDTATKDLVRKYVLARLHGSCADDEKLAEICHMYELTVKGLLLDWLTAGMPQPNEKSGETFASFFEASLPVLIKNL